MTKIETESNDEQGPTRALLHSEPSDRSRLRRALLYLRVSTPSQVRTDYDPEGISIPAQRASCERKATQMGDVIVVDEYVEPGKSGTSMHQRPAYQAMLERIRTQRDVDYVIIYKLSRMNRNRIDDALTITELRKYGVTLVSATESIDETPVGQLMHGILASFNEFRSAEDGADIRYKMGEKARRGGTLGRAPLGYMNIRERFDGREIRTVAIDPERAPFVRLAFELYATDRYTLEQLAEELTDRGLTTRPGRYAGAQVTDAKLSTLLRDRYYLGYVTYKGEEYQGRHEPIVDEELFLRVQRVLEGRTVARERDRVHRHYLKGTLWCGPCHDRGDERRMILARAKGNGGTYFYFFCRGRQDGTCREPYLAVESVEDAVEHHHETLSFSTEFLTRVRRQLDETLADSQHATNLHRGQLKKELARLEVQEENLIDLAANGALPSPKVRQRLNDIERRRAKLSADLDDVNVELGVGRELLDAALEWMRNPGDLYRRVSDQDRRLINQTFFEKLYIDNDQISSDSPREPFAEIIATHRAHRDAKTPGQRVTKGQDQSRSTEMLRGETKADLLAAALVGNGSSKTAMVELWRIELQTSSMPWKRSTN